MENQDDLFFSLSPSISELNQYSIFKVTRILKYFPFEDGERFKDQIDPMTKNKYFFPNDVDIFGIVEQSLETVIRAQGNTFKNLKFANIQIADKQECFLVGYQGEVNNYNLDIAAPITTVNSNLVNLIPNFSSIPTRKFSPGQILASNETCFAVSCSSWMGMSGGPLCLLKKKNDGKKKLYFCGIYNGSAATIFQNYIGKVLYKLQGVAHCSLTFQDLPKPHPSHKGYLLWCKILYNLLGILMKQYYNWKDFAREMSTFARKILLFSEKFGFPVEHNLIIRGGNRLTALLKGLARIFDFKINAKVHKKLHVESQNQVSECFKEMEILDFQAMFRIDFSVYEKKINDFLTQVRLNIFPFNELGGALLKFLNKYENSPENIETFKKMCTDMLNDIYQKIKMLKMSDLTL